MSPNATTISALPAYFCLPGSVGAEGRVLDSSDHVPAGKIASRGRLFVVLEPERDDEGIAAVARAVLTRIMQQFYAEEHRPVVSSLVRAVASANADLRRRNLVRPLRERIGIGVAAMVLRGDELQFCVVPPARAFVVQGGDVLSIGAGSYAGISSRAPFVRQMPLGLSDDVDPDLARIRAEPGTVVVLCSPQLGRLLLSLDNDELLVLGDAQSLADKVRDMARSRELMGGAFMALDIAVPLGSRRRSRGILEPLLQWIGRALGLGVRQGDPLEVVSSLRRRRRAVVGSVATNSQLVGGRVLGGSRTHLGFLAGLSFPRVFRHQPLPRLRYVEPRIPKKGRRGWVWYALTALAATVVIGLGVKAELDRQQAAKVEQLLTEAQRLNQEAAQERDPVTAQEKLKRASDLLDEAARARVNSDQVGNLLSQVDENLEAINGIYRLRLPRVVLDASPLGGKSRLWRLDGSNGHLYVLDQGLGAVLDFNQGALEVVQILAAGDTWGGLQVGAPVALGTSGGTLWVLDDKLQVFLREVSGGDWKGVKIPGTRDWGSVLDVASWGGSIYVLTTRPNQIFRVNLADIGAGGEPWLDDPADAQAATAIAVDGRIYLLTSEGKVERAVRGAVDAIFETKLDPPLVGASQIFSWSDVGSIFVLDVARERIVELSKDGKKVRQLKAPPGSNMLADARSIGYDPSTNTLYVVGSHHVWAAQVPPWK